MAEPEGAGQETTPEWVGTIEDEGLRQSLSSFESQDALLDAIGYKPPEPEPVEKDWREQITDEDLKKFAEESPDVSHLARRALEARQSLSKAIIPPGKDADEKAWSSYRKAMGIPEKVDDYEFPELPEGEELTDEMKEARTGWATKFHELGVPKEAAKNLWDHMQNNVARLAEAEIKADKEFADLQEQQLKTEWGADYEKNKAVANRALSEIANRAGLDVGDLTKIETKDGRFLLDRADVVKMFATIGREMVEGGLGPTLTDAERDTLDEELLEIRKKIQDAQSRGDNKTANKLYQQEQALIKKRDGAGPVVGEQGRAA